MQVVLALLALLVGAALADSMTILAPDDLEQENTDISSKEYLREIFEDNLSVSGGKPIYYKLRRTMEKLELFKALDILRQVDLDFLLRDIGYSSITLCLPTDAAITKWEDELRSRPSLIPSHSDLKNLVKAWIINDVVTSPSIKKNDVRRSINGAPLRFNKYDLPAQEEKLITVNGAQIVRRDERLPISKTIIHVIDKVLYPLPTDNVVETLVDVPAFSKFIELVNKAGLVEALSNADPITMFVPTNDALRSRPDIDDLEKNKTKLAEILEYHVHLKDTRYSASMLREERLVTARGALMFITPDLYGQIYLNKEKGESKRAKVLVADIPTTNGVLHIIDRVLTPPETRYLLV